MYMYNGEGEEIAPLWELRGWMNMPDVHIVERTSDCASRHQVARLLRFCLRVREWIIGPQDNSCQRGLQEV